MVAEEAAASNLARPGLWCARKGLPHHLGCGWSPRKDPAAVGALGQLRGAPGELAQSRIQQSWELLLALWRCQQGCR